MLIQNVSNVAQTPQPVRLTSDGAPGVVIATPSNAETRSGVAVESPAITTTPQQPSSQQLQNAVNGLNQAMRQSNQNLEFSLDPGTKEPIAKVVDTKTGELIRQFPSEEMLAIARSIDEFQQRQGLLLSHKA